MYRTGIFEMPLGRWLAFVEPERGYLAHSVHGSEADAEQAVQTMRERYAKTGITHPDFDAQRRYKAEQQES